MEKSTDKREQENISPLNLETFEFGKNTGVPTVSTVFVKLP